MDIGGEEAHLFSSRKHFSWSICTTTKKYGNQLVHALPLFLDVVFLHPAEWDPVFRAATQAFAIPGVLNHTAITIFHSDKLGNAVAEQLALSTPFLPWGVHVPPCNDCSTALLVCCKSRSGPTTNEKQVTICCFKCNKLGVVYRPTNARVIQQDIPDEKLFMRLTYPPRSRVQWQVRNSKEGGTKGPR